MKEMEEGAGMELEKEVRARTSASGHFSQQGHKSANNTMERKRNCLPARSFSGTIILVSSFSVKDHLTGRFTTTSEAKCANRSSPILATNPYNLRCQLSRSITNGKRQMQMEHGRILS